ncbi:MAG: methyltransferase [Gammaproteobacteria bacterium]|nr:methyltransferase [Gammaproteobacteria bacterium]
MNAFKIRPWSKIPMRFAFSLVLSATAQVAAGAGNDLDATTESAIDTAINGEHRSSSNKARDQYRKPKETLTFFGFRSDMTVVEAWPGTGWYTEILAPALRKNGKLYAAHYSANPSYGYNGVQRRFLGTFLQKAGHSPAIYDQLKITTLYYPYDLNIAPKSSADLLLTFRNAHNWVVPGYGGDAAAKATFRAMFDVLKPGGILGLVDHRWPDPKTEDPAAANGYISEDRVIELVTEAGFNLVERSDMHHNSKDSHNHPRGVWTLPPSLAMGDVDRDKYITIGESDRMTLKFRKPAKPMPE